MIRKMDKNKEYFFISFPPFKKHPRRKVQGSRQERLVFPDHLIWPCALRLVPCAQVF